MRLLSLHNPSINSLIYDSFFRSVEEKNTKLFYTIGEVSEMFNVNASLIRYWEKEFNVLKLRKNRKGNRLFTPKDIDLLHMIYHLVKERGYTLEGAKKKIQESGDEIQQKLEMVKSLKKMRSFLLELKDNLG